MDKTFGYILVDGVICGILSCLCASDMNFLGGWAACKSAFVGVAAILLMEWMVFGAPNVCQACS